MDGLARLFVLCIVLLGHFGWWVFAYNRINATGLPRPLVKFFERAVFLPITLLLPLLFAGLYAGDVSSWLVTGKSISTSATPLVLYALFCMAVVTALGPFWLYSRLYLISPKQFIEAQNVNQVDLRSKRQTLCQKSFTRNLSRLPGNCILELHSIRKSLAVSNWPEYLNGFRIGHISDLHFTGQLSPDFYRFALEELVALRPDMIAITGDIIDKAHCLPWIEELLGDLRAPHGCFFVLGNHDKRIADPDIVRRLMAQSGWVDLGGRVHELDIHGQRVLLAGHELPWFGGEVSFGAASPISELGPVFRLALSHSPDAIDWAQRERVDLLLSGHTHGGQVRFPLIGPVIAPSWYGSQFASGVFYRKPTLMHVSRGLAGVHPLRFRCQPEIALLELYASSKG